MPVLALGLLAFALALSVLFAFLALALLLHRLNNIPVANIAERCHLHQKHGRAQQEQLPT